jgi:hypothetical protein
VLLNSPLDARNQKSGGNQQDFEEPCLDTAPKRYKDIGERSMTNTPHPLQNDTYGPLTSSAKIAYSACRGRGGGGGTLWRAPAR